MDTGTAFVIGAVIAAVPSTASVFVVWRGQNRVVDKVAEKVLPPIAEIQVAVKTANALSLAQLADAVETRRILLKPEAERTEQESDHLRSVQGGLIPPTADS